jgi:riboflavin biosynthesis pyrimidine reductase
MRIVLVATQSLDGFITKHGQPGTAFTSQEDKTHFREMVAGFDAGVLGGETYRIYREAIRARLPGSKLRVVMTRSPDSHATEAVPGMLEFTSATPAILAAGLRSRGFSQCVLLGGSHVHSLFLAAGLVDEVWLTIEPVLFGAGTPLLAQPADLRLKVHTIERLGTSALLAKYHVLKMDNRASGQ